MFGAYRIGAKCPATLSGPDLLPPQFRQVKDKTLGIAGLAIRADTLQHDTLKAANWLTRRRGASWGAYYRAAVQQPHKSTGGRS